MRFVLILQLVLGAYVPAFAQTAQPLTEPMLKQMVSDIALNDFFAKARTVKRGRDLVKLLPDGMTARDRRWVEQSLRKMTKEIKFQRLNRGIAVVYPGEKYVITIEDVWSRRLRFNNKTDFTYHEGNPLEIQADVLGRALDRQNALFNLLVPEAHAYLNVALGVVIGFFMNGGLDMGSTVVKQMYCPGKTVKDSFFAAKTCKEYFEWVETVNKPSERVPNRDEIKSGVAPLAAAPSFVVPDCQRSSFESTPEEGSKVKMEMVFKGDKADKIYVTQSSNDNTKPLRLVISLDANNLLKTFSSAADGKILATNDPDLLKQMSANELADNQAQTKKASKLVTSMINFLNFCKEQGDKTLAKNAVQPADVKANEIAANAVVPPVAPTSTTTTPAPTTAK